MKAQRIEGTVALVTGANRGIGRALTEALLSRGVRKLYATARNPEALRGLRDERVVSLRLDVTQADQIRAAMPQIYTAVGLTSRTTSAICSAIEAASSGVPASTITRTSGSVPDGRSSTRPSPPS